MTTCAGRLVSRRNPAPPIYREPTRTLTRESGARRSRRPELAGLRVVHALASGLAPSAADRRRRHQERCLRRPASSDCCRRLSPACLTKAAISNSRMRVAGSSATRCRRDRRVLGCTNMRCPSVLERYARWCDTIITESFEWTGFTLAFPVSRSRDALRLDVHISLHPAVKDTVDFFSQRVAWRRALTCNSDHLDEFCAGARGTRHR
jgi:hypothetical protein